MNPPSLWTFESKFACHFQFQNDIEILKDRFLCKKDIWHVDWLHNNLEVERPIRMTYRMNVSKIWKYLTVLGYEVGITVHTIVTEIPLRWFSSAFSTWRTSWHTAEIRISILRRLHLAETHELPHGPTVNKEWRIRSLHYVVHWFPQRPCECKTERFSGCTMTNMRESPLFTEIWFGEFHSCSGMIATYRKAQAGKMK